MRYTDEDLKTWREDGYVIVEGFFTPEEVAQARADLHKLAPTWEQYRDERSNWPETSGLTRFDFPYEGLALNLATVHPALVEFAEAALETTDLQLCHSEILCKYADDADFDQEMHQDYGVNTLVVPPREYVDQLAAIVYYSDVDENLGPTRIVPFQESQHRWDKDFWSREDAPELYESERKVTVTAGSALLYTMKTFHRGAAFTTNEGARFSHHISFQTSDMSWGGWRSFPRSGPRPYMSEFLTAANPRQRSLVGFPEPGHAYWTESNLAAVALRYPDMDLSPYAAL